MMIISTVSTNLTNVWGSICGRNKHIPTIFQRENKVGRWSFNVSIHFWVWLEMLNSQDIRITKDNNWTDSKSIRIKQEYLNLHANFYSNFVSSQYVMITDLLLLYPLFWYYLYHGHKTFEDTIQMGRWINLGQWILRIYRPLSLA